MAVEALEMVENEERMIGIISHVRELREQILQASRCLKQMAVDKAKFSTKL